MSDKRHLFLSIFIAEIEDLEEDVGVLMGAIDRRHQERSITEYVYMENTSVLRHELLGLRRLVDDVKKTGLEGYPDLESLHGSLAAMIANEVKEYQFPNAVKELALKKLEKVRDYLRDGVCD